jgi:hypothetical protein
MTASETLTVADRIALTLDGLGRAVAARVLGGAMLAVTILLVWRRLRRIEGRIQGLLARFRAGRLWVRTVPRVGGRGGVGGCGAVVLPRGFGWLLPMVPQEAACFAGQMRGVLAEPEMVALLAAAPQARRVLAPLCRMLGIEAAVLVPAPVASAAHLVAEVPGLPAMPVADGEAPARFAETVCATAPPVPPVPRSTGVLWRSPVRVGSGMRPAAPDVDFCPKL